MQSSSESPEPEAAHEGGLHTLTSLERGSQQTRLAESLESLAESLEGMQAGVGHDLREAIATTSMSPSMSPSTCLNISRSLLQDLAYA